MKKWLISFAIIILIFAVLFSVYQSEIIRYTQYAKKYSAINIAKNQGWKRSTLELVSSALDFVPTPRQIPSSQISAYFDEFPRLSIEYPSYHKEYINNVESLILALQNVTQDTILELAPGEYDLGKDKTIIDLKHRVWLTAINKQEAVIKVNANVGFEIRSSNFTIDGIRFEGDCDIDSRCEHALHITGDTNNLLIINNDFVNFNAAIKSNGLFYKEQQQRLFPDGVTVSNNRFYNQWVRQTKNSVTPIDVVGGDNWRIENNFIADFAKSAGNKVTFGAFLKGAGRFGRITDNVVACRWKVDYYSVLDARVGLSLGGGGTGRDLCQQAECEYEHSSGVIERNVVFNCANEVSIYLNRTESSTVTNNLLFNTVGIDVSKGNVNALINDNQFHGIVMDKSSSADTKATVENNFQLSIFEKLGASHSD